MVKETYTVAVDIKARVKVETLASSIEEAYENVQDDYENSQIWEFLENYNTEVTGFEME